MNTKKEMTKGTKIALTVSGSVFVLGLVIAVLFTSQTITLTENMKMVVALAITVAMIVFAYTLCKHLGVLKNQRRKA